MVLPTSVLQASWTLWATLAVLGPEAVKATPVSPEADDGGSLNELPDRASIWKPTIGTSWQIVLLNPIKITSKPLSPNVRVWDLDLYDNSAATFRALRKRGKRVICYFSAGTWETWRNDANKFNESDLGNPLQYWPGEKWLNIRSTSVRNIMKQRIALAAKKGCDALDPDNINGFDNNNGFNLMESDAVDYLKFLSKTAASYGLAIGLKNSPSIIPQVINDVQFAVVESCSRYSECALYQPLIQANKPVFQIEYPGSAGTLVSADTMNTICPASNNLVGNKRFSVLMKNVTLDGWTQYCGSGQAYTTTTIVPKSLWAKLKSLWRTSGHPKREIEE